MFCSQVKLLKCLIDNIVVDISYAQLGGVCTLNFLEEIDRKVGKDNLFKRSIILVSIKAHNISHSMRSMASKYKW